MSPRRALVAGLPFALSARAQLREVGGWLSEEAVPVMPLKGVLLQSALYGQRWKRAMSDIDILIPERHYARSLRVLLRHGCTCTPNSATETYVQMPGRVLPLDLHRRLLVPSTFGLDTAGVFERARVDHHLFGAEFWLLDPLDLYAHLVGHFLSSRTSPTDPERLADFSSVAHAHSLVPELCARHLEQQGLGRAARCVLPWLVENAQDAFARDVLASLEPDAVGANIAAGCRFLMSHATQDSKWAMIATHALGRSLPSGFIGCARRSLDYVRHHHR